MTLISALAVTSLAREAGTDGAIVHGMEHAAGRERPAYTSQRDESHSPQVWAYVLTPPTSSSPSSV